MSELEEIRSDLNNLDTEAANLLDWMEFNNSKTDEEDLLIKLRDQLNNVQATITSIQEKQGWI